MQITAKPGEDLAEACERRGDEIVKELRQLEAAAERDSRIPDPHLRRARARIASHDASQLREELAVISKALRNDTAGALKVEVRSRRKDGLETT